MKTEKTYTGWVYYVRRVPRVDDKEPKKWLIYGRNYDTEEEALIAVKQFEDKEKTRKFVIMKGRWVLTREKIYETQ